MWIYLSDSYLSIVEYRDDPTQLLVRARCPGDLERVFGPEISVAETPTHDYRYRTVLPRQRVAEVLADRVLAINYPNFKNSVREHDRHDAYFSAWSAMGGLQRRRHSHQ